MIHKSYNLVFSTIKCILYNLLYNLVSGCNPGLTGQVKALEEVPNAMQLRLWLAETHIGLGNLDEAEGVLTFALLYILLTAYPRRQLMVKHANNVDIHFHIATIAKFRSTVYTTTHYIYCAVKQSPFNFSI